jgi:uncharacterized spore protein YtfJ
MKISDIVDTARDTLTVKRVYAEPYVQGSLTIIPAATVTGGAGGGGGRDQKGNDGEGGGFGVNARPVGAYIIRDGQVEWRPAIDVNRIIGAVGLVLAAYLIARPRLIRTWARAAAQRRRATDR